jgi:hypothetical protein
VALDTKTLGEPSKAWVASIGSGRAARRGFERWLIPDVSPGSGFIPGCPDTWCPMHSSFMFSIGGWF